MSISRKMSAFVVVSVMLISVPSLWVYYDYTKELFLQKELAALEHISLKTINRKNAENETDISEYASALLAYSKYQGVQHFLLDKHGNAILAGPWQQALEDHRDSFSFSSGDKALLAMLDKPIEEKSESVKPLTIKDIHYHGVAVAIAPMGARYYKLVPTDNVLAPLKQKFVQVSLYGFIALSLLAFIIKVITQRWVVSPLVQIASRIRAYRHSDTLPDLILTNNDEISLLNDALSEMHHELTRDSQQLLDSERRYRQVVTNISEAIVQVDVDKNWLFLSPVWKKLSGYDLHYSLNRQMADFFHPADQVYIKEVVSLLLDNKMKTWSGKLRLKRNDKRNIWVKLSLHGSKDKHGMTLNGTLEDIHFNHISQSINTLIRESEQKVMSSNCSVTTVLEFVTQRISTILDLPLVWVKICEDNQSQILSYAGEVADFLFDGDKTWSGLHSANGPVMEAIKDHIVIRATSLDTLDSDWAQRLEHDDIKDSLFVPFYLAGGKTHAIIGLHSDDANVFEQKLKKIMAEFASALRLVCQMAEDQHLIRLHQAAVEKTANAIMITDFHGRIEWVNQAFTKQTLYHSDEVLGHTPLLLNSDSKEARYSLEDMWATIKQGEVWSGELVNRRKDGRLITVYQTITPLINDLGDISHYVSVSEDVTERKENQQKINFMATHDELTLLPNRNLLNDRLKQAITQAQRHNTKMAVLFIDIDHFKYINDSLGHQVGDELLKVLSERLASVLRQGDTVARFGGDEFVIVLPEIEFDNDIKVISNNLLKEIQRPYDIEGHELLITGSIGISLYPDDANDAEHLIQHADSAMYLAKQQGRNNSQFYTPEINEKVMRRLTLEKALRQAVKLKQFVLYYQPKVDLLSNKITGVEALIRWQHPELGLVSPAEFIPLAEETGVIIELGDWVILEACTQMKKWQDIHPELNNMSINVSARQFWQADFKDQVASIFAETQVRCDSIELELTESVVMDDVDTAITTMKSLKKLGLSLSLDDFGTGYSSLSYLQRFPVDVLKIDRSFVSELKTAKSNSSIIRSIIALANNFGLKVVGEGIEQAFQQQILTELGCDYGQGYYFSRPVNAEQLSKLLTAD